MITIPLLNPCSPSSEQQAVPPPGQVVGAAAPSPRPPEQGQFQPPSRPKALPFHLDKFIWQFGQIYLKIETNIFCTRPPTRSSKSSAIPSRSLFISSLPFSAEQSSSFTKVSFCSAVSRSSSLSLKNPISTEHGANKGVGKKVPFFTQKRILYFRIRIPHKCF